MLPNSASFLLSEDCNMRCTYCFEHGGFNQKSMSKEIARLSIEMLIQNAKREGLDRISVTLFGGEPLMNFETVKFIIEFLMVKRKADNIGVGVTLITNGTILTEEMADFFRRTGPEVALNIQLSVDGIKEVHDKCRIFKGGGGTFDVIEEKIPLWKSLGDGVNIHGSYNQKTIPYMFESFKYFKEQWGIHDIWFMPIQSDLTYNMDDLKIYREQLTLIKDYLVKEIRTTRNKRLIRSFSPLDRVFNRACEFGKPCGAGDNYVSITADGDIYPCHHFYFEDKEGYTKIGDVFTGIDDQRRLLFLEYDHNDMTCKAEKPSCSNYGCYRCIADNYSINGSILSNIMGVRCAMSGVENDLMNQFEQEVKELGLDKVKGELYGNIERLC